MPRTWREHRTAQRLGGANTGDGLEESRAATANQNVGVAMSQIWIGDWLRTWRKLGLSAVDNTNVQLADLFGLGEIFESSGATSLELSATGGTSGSGAMLAGDDPPEFRESGPAVKPDDVAAASLPPGPRVQVGPLP